MMEHPEPTTWSSHGINTTMVSPRSIGADPDLITMEWWTDVITKYLWIVPVAVGVPGNIMTILVALQKDNRQFSTCVFMVALATADTLKLSSVCWGYTAMFHTDSPSELQAQGIWYSGHASAIFSGFVLMEMTIDRMQAVRDPISARAKCTTSKAIKTIFVTAILVYGVDLHIFWVYRYTVQVGEQALSVTVPGYPALETLVLAFHFVCGTLLPFVVIVSCNILIIRTLRQASETRGKMGADSTNQERETSHLTRMLIIVCLAYVITSLPYRLYDLFLLVPSIGRIYDMSEKYWKVRYVMQFYAVVHLWEWNYAINFPLYCVGGGKKYRDDVKRLIQPLCSCAHGYVDK